jgi:hypothetical protein
MTIRLGESTVSGTNVELKAPGGFGTFQAIRLTNYTANVLIITGIDSDDPGSQEYLLPLQQNVYRTNNVGNIPKVTGINLGALTAVPTVLVEWSDNPLKDFPGIYPTAIGIGVATPSVNIVRVALSLAFTTYVIPGNPFRKRISIFNACDYVAATDYTIPGVDGRAEWTATNTGWGSVPLIPQGCERIIETTAPLYFRSLTGLLCTGHQVYIDYHEETYA